MLKYCLDKWNQNKLLLENKIRKDRTINSCDYLYLVKLVVDFVLNPDADKDKVWDSERITRVDDGEYQGTVLFLIPAKVYQPEEYEYLMTYAGYGSCSGCDTLQAIQGGDDESPLTEEQVGNFMVLCKDILANIIKPYNYGWRHTEDFDEVL